MSAINFKNINFAYTSEHPVFEDFSLSIEQGKYITIIGHNGSGKSTLAKLIVGLLIPEKGEIEVLGRVLDQKSVYDIRGEVGIVFQNPDNQFIGATVEDDIAFGLENHLVPQSEMKGIIDASLKRIDMEAFIDKEPSNLSGGQKQRVAIAGVLAMKPKILILDEATAMLDPKGKQEIRTLISEMREEFKDLTIISITHDIEETLLSDQVMVLNQGKIAFLDTPANVFKHHCELAEMDLSTPFIFQLNQELKNQGLDFDIFDEEEMVKKLCQ